MDFVRFVPESTDPQLSSPKILFEFEDGNFKVGDSYEWYLVLFETGYPEVDLMDWSNPNGPGLLTSVPTQPIEVPVPTEVPRGVYGFSVYISKMRNGVSIDFQTHRSEDFQFYETGVTTPQISNDSDVPTEFHYRIKKVNNYPATEALSQVEIVALTPDFDIGDKVSGDTTVTSNIEPVDPSHRVVAPFSGSTDAGEERIIATGVDNEAALHRGHRNKRILPENVVAVQYKVLLLNGPDMGRTGGDLRPNGGSHNANWESVNPKQLIHILPGQTTNPTALPQRERNRLKEGRLIFEEIETYRFLAAPTPKQLWNEIRMRCIGAQKRIRQGWNPIIVNPYAHGTPSSIQISFAQGGNEDIKEYPSNGYYSSWQSRGSVTAPDYTPGYDSLNLFGVRFFHVMGCSTSENAIGIADSTRASKFDYQANAGDIGNFFSTQNHAVNSIGYNEDVETNLQRSQVWYNKFYRYGLAASANNTAKGSMLATEREYNEWLREMLNKKDNFLGWQHWVLSNNTPLLDPIVQ